MTHHATPHDEQDLPLPTVPPGRWARVCAIAGGRGAASRLAHLGLMPGHALRMVRPSRFGPVLVDVKGSRLALGQGLARKISVRQIDSPAAARPA